MSRTAHDLALSALKVEEGYRQHPYPDAGDTLAIGYGLNLHRRGLSRRQAEWLLADTLRELDYALRLMVGGYADLAPARQAAVLEMAYQMGVAGVHGFTKFWAAVGRKHWNVAVRELLDSDWARQTPARAKRVAERFRRGGDDPA